MHKKYHEKFKILGILAVTTQAREGIETQLGMQPYMLVWVTTQAHQPPVPVPGKILKKSQFMMIN